MKHIVLLFAIGLLSCNFLVAGRKGHPHKAKTAIPQFAMPLKDESNDPQRDAIRDCALKGSYQPGEGALSKAEERRRRKSSSSSSGIAVSSAHVGTAIALKDKR